MNSTSIQRRLGDDRQWHELVGQVRRDKESSLVIFNKEFEAKPDPDDAGDDGKGRVTPHPKCSTPRGLMGIPILMEAQPASSQRVSTQEAYRVFSSYLRFWSMHALTPKTCTGHRALRC